METIESLIRCTNCKTLLEDPVILPCGNTICSKHIKQAVQKKELFSCDYCKQSHPTINYTFPPNMLAKRLIQSKLKQLDFCENYKITHRAFLDLKELVDEYEKNKADPTNFIYSYFGNVKNEIDSLRVNLKSKIDRLCEKLILEIQIYQRECEEHAKAANMNHHNEVKLHPDMADLEDDVQLDHDYIHYEPPAPRDLLQTLNEAIAGHGDTDKCIEKQYLLHASDLNSSFNSSTNLQNLQNLQSFNNHMHSNSNNGNHMDGKLVSAVTTTTSSSDDSDDEKIWSTDDVSDDEQSERMNFDEIRANLEKWGNELNRLAVTEVSSEAIELTSQTYLNQFYQQIKQMKRLKSGILLNKSHRFEKKFCNIREIFCRELKFNK
jgi:hypothetical protein